MQRRYFIEIPPVGETKFFSIPEKEWKVYETGLKRIAKEIGGGCTIVERFAADVLKGRPSVWCDEEGFINRQLPNMLASRLGNRHIVGTAFLEVGSFDLMKAEDAAKWDKKLAGWPKMFGGLQFKPDSVEGV